MLKKAGIVLLVILGLMAIGGGWYYHENYTGENYYVKITTNSEKLRDTEAPAAYQVYYEYALPAFNEAGQQRQVTFDAFRDNPLRRNAYLKVAYNHTRGVILSYEEVQQKDIPKKAASKLN